MNNDTRSDARHQNVTRANATHHNERYTVEEIDFVVAFTDTTPDHEIADALGRSLYAIVAIQARLRAGDYDALVRRALRDAAPVRTCPSCFMVIPLALDACETC